MNYILRKCKNDVFELWLMKNKNTHLQKIKNKYKLF